MFDFTQHWYRPSFSLLTFLLLPFSWLYGVVLWVRRHCYRLGLQRVHTFSIPVIVVGNITVGGTGKTPLVIWLANYLRAQGYRPGIVSRGYGGKNKKQPQLVTKATSASEVGDEALLLAANTECPTIVCRDRAAAVRALQQQTDCNIVLADDGLQHYRLGAAIKIAIVDNERQFGNGQLLPAGPLREPVNQLTTVDYVISHGKHAATTYAMCLEPVEFVAMQNGAVNRFADFVPKKIHAIAGIGHPERFFTMLRQAGFEVIAHCFPDHYHFKAEDLEFADQHPIVMTEKDAVKCTSFANERCWYVRVAAKLNESFVSELMQRIELCNQPSCRA